MEHIPDRAEMLMFALIKELKRIGILSASEIQHVVSNYVDLRTMMPPKPSIEDVAAEPLSVMLVMMADKDMADLYMRMATERREDRSEG